jgi:hypothetical protein
MGLRNMKVVFGSYILMITVTRISSHQMIVASKIAIDAISAVLVFEDWLFR